MFWSINIRHFSIILFGLLIIGCGQDAPSEATDRSAKGNQKATASSDSLRYEQEKHLKNVRQLTFGGNNAEAYWSFDNEQLVFQAENPKWDIPCDQIFYMDTAGLNGARDIPPMVSTGNGRTTCAYFMPGDSTIIYASTHLGGKDCPEEPERRVGGKYVWPIYESYDIFVADLEGNILRQLTDEPGYDAEPTVSPTGDKIVFTSMRSGDLELFTMDLDGSNVQQITDELGYDGGAFFSPDGEQLIFRASRPDTDSSRANYLDLLERGLVQPTEMELFIVNADGSNLRQITELGGANWAPFFHPSGEKVLFSSNHDAERGFSFNLFLVNLDGTGLQQVTYDKTFDSFPMFSPNGDYLVFGSNRNNGDTRNTNIFLAEWVE